MAVGLGTGSTVYHALVRLAERIREERLSIRGVPTSLDTERKARSLGIDLVDLAEVRSLDLTIDGADEIDSELNMIKGGGGALLREKVVASISARDDRSIETAIDLSRDHSISVHAVTAKTPVVNEYSGTCSTSTPSSHSGLGSSRSRDAPAAT